MSLALGISPYVVALPQGACRMEAGTRGHGSPGKETSVPAPTPPGERETEIETTAVWLVTEVAPEGPQEDR